MCSLLRGCDEQVELSEGVNRVSNLYVVNYPEGSGLIFGLRLGQGSVGRVTTNWVWKGVDQYGLGGGEDKRMLIRGHGCYCNHFRVGE